MESGFLLSIFLLLPAYAGARQLQQQCESCVPPIPFDSTVHKLVYTVGAYKLRNVLILDTFNTTFQDYLTATAGKRFDPPIKFEANFFPDHDLAYDLVEANDIDFVFENPFVASCLENQYDTQPLLSTVRTTSFGGQKLSLSHFAGMIITHVDNKDINTLEDLKGKVVAAVNPGALGGGLAQFHEMQKSGMSHLDDPAAIVFAKSMFTIVNGVLDKSYDVGLIRTRLIEAMQHNTPDLNVSAIKVVGIRTNEDGTLDEDFPLERSTAILPEWKFSATRDTHVDVVREVQAALLALEGHGRTGVAREECILLNPNSTVQCNELRDVDPLSSCDATVDSVSAAGKVTSAIDHFTYRPPLPVNRIRKMALDLGSIQEDPASDSLKCYRPANFYEQIVCPKDRYKLSRDAFEVSCNKTGVVCPDGMNCICKPCFKALPIEIAPTDEYAAGAGCQKMSICGELTQNSAIQYTVVDNQKLEGGRDLWAKTLEDGFDTEIAIQQGPSPHMYSFSLSTSKVGIFILEIYDGDIQIEASPLRVKVEYRTCQGDKEANADGECECIASSVTIAGRCVEIWLVVVCGLSPVLIIAAIVMYVFVKDKEREANSLWTVDRSDLKLNDPPTVLGHGSFGFVLQGEYRGSKVAVKRVLLASGKTGGLDSSIFGPPLKLDDSLGSSNLVGEEAEPGSTGRSTDYSVDLEVGESGAFGSSNRSRSSSRGQARLSQSMHTMSTLMMTKRNTSGQSMKQAFIDEMRVLSKLRHPNITTLMGAVINGSEPMLIMEYMEHGSLHEVLQNPTTIIESNLMLHLLKDIAQGVRYLHASNPPVIHGDLKSGNILIDSKFRAKLADFGMTKRRQKQATGTPLWMAPELLSNESINTPMTDMYSVGVILNEIVSGKEPYHETSDELSVIMKGVTDSNRRPEIPSYCPVKVRKLIKFLWHADPSLRPTAQELNNRLEDMSEQLFEDCARVPESHRIQGASVNGDVDFLYQAFPRHVANILRSGGKVKAEPHDSVSICFSDIVGFTTIASTLDPMKVSNMLDRLYLKFDEVTRKYDLFKVETVGDAYMCAGNLAKDQEDHVARIALFALGICKAASETLIDEEDPSLGYTMIRVGFHCGPVVSNVVGSLNPRFGVFGDTVNVAARMETTSTVGKVQCSEACAKSLIKQESVQLHITRRGLTEIKGRGRMMTYWVAAA